MLLLLVVLAPLDGGAVARAASALAGLSSAHVMPLALVRGIKEAESQLVKQSGIATVLGFTCRLLAIHYPTALHERCSHGPVGVHRKTCPKWL